MSSVFVCVSSTLVFINFGVVSDQDLAKLVQNGGVDALIWLCRSQQDGELHFYATSALAILSEKGTLICHVFFSSFMLSYAIGRTDTSSHYYQMCPEATDPTDGSIPQQAYDC